MLTDSALKDLCDFSHPSPNAHLEDISLPSNPQSLLKTFKQLRERLKAATKDTAKYKQQLTLSEISQSQLQETIQQVTTKSIKLQEQVTKLTKTNDDLMKKMAMCKESLKGYEGISEEVGFLKGSIMDLRLVNQRVKEEKRKLLETGAEETLVLEEKIRQLEIKIECQNTVIQQHQIQNHGLREKNIKLQKELKKLEMNLDEEIFTKKWSKDNFQSTHLHSKVKDLQSQLFNFKNKHSSLTSKRTELEDRLIHLESLAEYRQVQIDMCQGQIVVREEKCQHMQRKMKEYKGKYERMQYDYSVQEGKMFEVKELIEELREQIRGERLDKSVVSDFEERLKRIDRFDEKNDHNISSDELKVDLTQTLSKNPEYASSSLLKPHSILSDRTIRLNLPSTFEQDKPSSSNVTFAEECASEWSQQAQLQNKLRKQRQQAERLIRQKMIQRKLEAAHQNDQYRIRSQYIKTYIQR